MPHHPESIGAYKILDVLGEGGMGVVYAAEQTEPVRRRVALKVIKLGMDTKEVLARFEAERQALAMLDHPNIAKVLEAGATAEGRPYFAMEMVRGVGITKYCDIEQATIAQRLSLVLQACAALQHAHERGILHRDVKPTNMLVSEVDGAPMVKVIDFGLAKAMNQQLTERTLFTEAGRLLGTPEYMSPEQADLTALEVDQRTDVYSLGVTLYELLAGALPFDAQRMRAGGYPEIQRLIKEEEPPTPSQRLSRLKNGVEEIARLRNCRLRELSGSLRRGLDAVVMKALSKRRQDRYASCAELAADIERFLRGEPVLAKPAGFVGRWTAKVRRFHKRYPVLPAVALVTAVMLFVLRDPAATVADDPAPVGGKRFDGTMSGMGEEGDFVVYSRDAWRALPPHESVLGARVRADEEFEGAVFAIQVDDCGGREQILQALWKRQGAAMAEDKGDIDHHWIVGRKSLFFGLDERFDASTHKGVLKILLLVGDRLDAGLLEQQVRFVLRRMARLHGLKPEDVGLNGKHVDLVARMIRDFEASRQQPSQNDADILAIVDVPRSQSLLEPIITSRAEPMGTVTMITLHHSAMPSPRSRRGALAQALAMQTTHVTQNKWADIGYHFLIDGEGRIHEARPLCYQGASAGAVNNEGSIGICLLGNYAKGTRGQRLLPNQEAALARLIDSLRVRFAVPPSACVGHSELKETECPGPEPLEWLKRYRQEAARQGGK